MSLFEERLKAYREQFNNKQQGIENCISFKPFFPKFSTVLPGIMRRSYYAITAFSNVGKTPLAKYLFLLIPLWHAKKSKLKVKIFYFCLEESKEQFYDSIVCHKIKEVFKKEYSMLQLNSMFEDGNIDKEMLDKLEQFNEYFKWFDTIVTVINDVDNPTGIYKTIRKYAEENGKFYYNDNEVNVGGNKYVPNNADEYVIVVVDHVNKLSVEKGCDTLFAAMQKHSETYMLNQVVNTFGYTVADVHQQAMEGENAEYSKFTHNEATTSTLGDNKKIIRNYHYLFGLDAPQKFGIKVHRGNEIANCGGSAYRGLNLLKSRYTARAFLGLVFNPYSMIFKELEK